MIHPLWNEYPQLQKELKQTLTIMQQSVNLANKEVEAAILTMMHSGGKMLRPRLFATLFLLWKRNRPTKNDGFSGVSRNPTYRYINP